MNRRFWIPILGFTLIRLLIIGQVGLAQEEAYHWNFAQHPSLSYFDHPAMVGWLIGLSTLFSSQMFFVRLPAVLLFVASSWFLYDLGRRMFGETVGLFSALMLNFTPIFALFSAAILPDSPHLLAWCAGLWAGWRLVESGEQRWWVILGFITGLGMISKYPALLIPLPAIAMQRRRGALLCYLIAFLLFTPVLLWNAQHHWASFLFQGAQRMGEARNGAYTLRSWLFQLGMVTPAGLVLILWAQLKALGRRSDPRFLYLTLASLPFLTLMAVLSLRRLVQINWPMPGYVASVVLVVALLVEGWPRTRAAVFALALFGGLLSYLPWLPALVPIGAFNGLDTFDGWKEMADRAQQARLSMPRPERTFFLGNGYPQASEVAYCLRMPHQVLAQNALGLPGAVSYQFWEDPRDFAGWDAVVVDEGTRFPLPAEAVTRCFERVDPVESFTIDRGGKPLRHVRLYRAYGYRPERAEQPFHADPPG